MPMIVAAKILLALREGEACDPESYKATLAALHKHRAITQSPDGRWKITEFGRRWLEFHSL